MCEVDPGNGPAYVREGGQLRGVSNIVLADPRPASSCRRTKPLALRKEHFKFTYNARGNLRYSARSLFDISLLFVADNTHRLDSLRGFPEQIGEKLFAAAEEKCVFSHPDTAPRALQVFSDAYGDVVLKALCLRNRFPLLSERMCEIKTFHSLESLDLFGCRLGDNHDIFQHLTSSSLASSLIELFIGGNCLSDVGLQRLTAPIRMFKKGLDNLQHLDLSDNPISEKVVRYLTCLPKLQSLDVSGTHLELGTELKKSMLDLTGLVHSENPLSIFSHSRCKTEGWAEQVVNQWEMIASQVPKQKKIEESRKSALRFFGRQKFVSDVLNSTPLAREKEQQEKTEKLHFHRPAPGHFNTEENVARPTYNHNHGGKKRQRHLEGGSGGGRPHSPHSPPAKRFSSSSLSVEDVDLLNRY